jgi:hypothetical protein
MNNDQDLLDVRKAREDLSNRFGGDINKIYAYLKEEELKLAGKVKIARKKKVKSSKL